MVPPAPTHASKDGRTNTKDRSEGNSGNSSPPEVYRYTKLPKNVLNPVIRLVVLLPPSKDKWSPIRCILCQESLQSNPTYEALSYVWGDQNEVREIEVNNKVFSVTINLEEALRVLRYQTEHRILWVDAICINQGDLEEKTSQIQLMGEIYSRATKTIIWLGPETNSSSSALSALAIWNAFLAAGSSKSDKVDSSSCEDCLRGIEEIFPALAEKFMWKGNGVDFANPAAEPYLQGVIRLLNRPWWRRVWVLQEVALSPSPTIYCGKRTLEWRDFNDRVQSFAAQCISARVRLLTRKNWKGGSHVKSAIESRISLLREAENATMPLIIMDILRQSSQNKNRFSLPILLSMTQRFKSTDARDKVYALLSLVRTDTGLGNIGIPDYTISPETLYTRAAKYLICRRQDLFILENISSGNVLSKKDQASFLPSWVPDFRVQNSVQSLDGTALVYWLVEEVDETKLTAFKMQHNPKKRIFNAALEEKSPEPFRFSTDLTLLMVNGVFVDIVTRVMDPCDENVDSCLKSWKTEIMSSKPEGAQYIRGRTVDEAYWRSVLANHWARDGCNPASIIGDHIPSLDCDEPVSCMPPQSNVEEKNIRQKLQRLSVHDPPVCYRRRLFETSTGLIGLGPQGAENGDHVTILVGARVPIVLRKEGDRYKVVGERYVVAPIKNLQRISTKG